MKKFIYIMIIGLLVACGGEDKTKVQAINTSKSLNAKFVGIKNNDQFILGTDLNIQVQLKNLDQVESLEVFYDNQLVYNQKPEKDQAFVNIKTDTGKVGFINIKLVAKFKGQEKPTIDNRQIVFFSNESPKMLTAKKAQVFPHDINHYTQGLEFDGDQLWESTGQRGESKVAKIDLNTGQTLQEVKLNSSWFGEGMTILGDKIYQLTWQAGKCLVYDKNTLEKINEFTYSGEGWGLTNNGKELIMTDGSSKIYFRNAETFEIVKTLYAFDHSKEWPFLNEIEWVEGKIYANVYQKTDIIVINPETGKVEQVIDVYDVDREMKLGNPKSDVLNGIAFNKKTKSLFITGKNYPKLLKISID